MTEDNQQPPRPNPSAPQRLGWPRGTGEMFRTWVRQRIIAPRVRVWQLYQKDIAARRTHQDDRMIADIIRRHARAVKAGVGCSGETMKIDGLWVIVSVERSTSQRD